MGVLLRWRRAGAAWRSAASARALRCALANLPPERQAPRALVRRRRCRGFLPAPSARYSGVSGRGRWLRGVASRSPGTAAGAPPRPPGSVWGHTGLSDRFAAQQRPGGGHKCRWQQLSSPLAGWKFLGSSGGCPPIGECIKKSRASSSKRRGACPRTCRTAAGFFLQRSSTPPAPPPSPPAHTNSPPLLLHFGGGLGRTELWLAAACGPPLVTRTHGAFPRLRRVAAGGRPALSGRAAAGPRLRQSMPPQPAGWPVAPYYRQ